MNEKNDVGAFSTSGLTLDDIRNFLLTKVKNHHCPLCLTNAWAVIGDEKHVLGIIGLPNEGGFSIPPPNIPVAGVSCNECGYIRMHNLGNVAKWKLQGKK